MTNFDTNYYLGDFRLYSGDWGVLLVQSLLYYLGELTALLCKHTVIPTRTVPLTFVFSIHWVFINNYEMTKGNPFKNIMWSVLGK